MNGGKHQMDRTVKYKQYRPKDELYNLNTDTTEKVCVLLKNFKYFSFDECREELDCIVESLLNIPFEFIPPVEERNKIVELITEEYFRLFVEFPRQDVLSKLGDFILLDYLKNRSKSKYEENVFHSNKQIKRRLDREHMMVLETMDYFHTKKNLNLPSLHKKSVKRMAE